MLSPLISLLLKSVYYAKNWDYDGRYAQVIGTVRAEINFTNKNNRILLAIILGLFSTLLSFSSLAEVADMDKPVIVIRTVDVQGGSEVFLEMIGKAIATAKTINPQGKGKARILGENINGVYALLITVATTYPDFLIDVVAISKEAAGSQLNL